MTPPLDQCPVMTVEEFRLLRDLIYDYCGLYFRDEMRYLLERRLAPRLQVHALQSFKEYHHFLRYDVGRRAELDSAVEILTTNETYFYREPHQLRAFSEEILPVLAQERARERKLRIWSAGCSTGEEVYTIAILLRTSGLFDGWDVDIFGSDIARRVLAVARAGVYGANAFRNEEAEGIRRWFRPADGGKLAVLDAVRKDVSFSHLNLLDEGMMSLVGRVDAIFCRNVMIYFDLPARKRVVRSFHDKLQPGGFLMLGHSESLLNVTADFELVHLKNDLVYRKPYAASSCRATP
ncbi:CheR family methyltransferase [Anaeromyxobacter paludicola]|uniref:protein-glutamate O-methyltransferase n=1 Tax=Anaeromyxobacter paludicola TaxID=2918171 RepID=A0ABM7X546_9BACT|nr:protein-glutamate O-methyltransferase CheR [Anaeromyxobacter paludicola]BDG06937.1 chemotaxis protein methyltransferase [Anaeromyxobacter paludicola]